LETPAADPKTMGNVYVTLKIAEDEHLVSLVLGLLTNLEKEAILRQM
jgi:hypothetical protein